MKQQPIEYETFTELFHALADVDDRTDGFISEQVTVFKRGDSKLEVRTPRNKENTVLEIVSKAPARVMDREEKKNRIEMMIGMGRSSNGTVYDSSVRDK